MLSLICIKSITEKYGGLVDIQQDQTKVKVSQIDSLCMIEDLTKKRIQESQAPIRQCLEGHRIIGLHDFCYQCIWILVFEKTLFENFSWSILESKYTSKNENIVTCTLKLKEPESIFSSPELLKRCNECGQEKIVQNGNSRIIEFLANPFFDFLAYVGICEECTDFRFIQEMNLQKFSYHDYDYDYVQQIDFARSNYSSEVVVKCECKCGEKWEYFRKANFNTMNLKSRLNSRYINRTINISFCISCKEFRNNVLKYIFSDVDLGKIVMEMPVENSLNDKNNLLNFMHSIDDFECEKGHVTSIQLIHKIFRDGCSECYLVGVSQIERDFYSILKNIIPDLKSNEPMDNARWSSNNSRMRPDFISHTSFIAIEYDGSYFHSGKFNSLEKDIQRDIEKTLAMIEAGYTVIRIRESPLFNLPDMEGLYQILHDNKGAQGGRKYTESIATTIANLKNIFLEIQAKV